MSEQFYIHANLKQLSHSSNTLLHGCPRRYELYKMSPSKAVQEENEDLDFGTLVGIGLQEFFVSNNLELAHFKMFLSWNKAIDDEDGLRKKKTFWFALQAVNNFVVLRNSVFANYDVAILAGKPACELGFSIDCGDGFTYRGFIDIVLINRITKELVCLEIKTTGNRNVHEAMYKNSGQGLGYGLILDVVSEQLGMESSASYKVHYVVYKSNDMEWVHLPFTKSRVQRALWIKQLLIDKQHIIEYATDSYFPMHGEYCYSFYHPCKWFGVCELSNKHIIGNDVEIRTDDPEKYSYKFDIVELIEQQLSAAGE